MLKPNDIFDLVNNCLADIPLGKIAQAASTAGSRLFRAWPQARGPKRVTDVEEAATRAHVDPQALEQRAPTSASSPPAAMPGGVQAVQWRLPGRAWIAATPTLSSVLAARS